MIGILVYYRLIVVFKHMADKISRQRTKGNIGENMKGGKEGNGRKSSRRQRQLISTVGFCLIYNMSIHVTHIDHTNSNGIVGKIRPQGPEKTAYQSTYRLSSYRVTEGKKRY